VQSLPCIFVNPRYQLMHSLFAVVFGTLGLFIFPLLPPSFLPVSSSLSPVPPSPLLFDDPFVSLPSAPFPADMASSPSSPSAGPHLPPPDGGLVPSLSLSSPSDSVIGGSVGSPGHHLITSSFTLIAWLRFARPSFSYSSHSRVDVIDIVVITSSGRSRRH
jgi:hypothetical protein